MVDPKNMDLFQTLCFLACMQHGNGLIDKAPSYITEKKKIIESPLAAWQMLDFELQCIVAEWSHKWELPLWDYIEEISQDV